MAKTEDPAPKLPLRPLAEKERREAKLALALRANLRRRKAPNRPSGKAKD